MLAPLSLSRKNEQVHPLSRSLHSCPQNSSLLLLLLLLSFVLILSPSSISLARLLSLSLGPDFKCFFTRFHRFVSTCLFYFPSRARARGYFSSAAPLSYFSRREGGAALPPPRLHTRGAVLTFGEHVITDARV